MKLKKLQGSKDLDPEWIKVIAEILINKNIDKFSDSKKKMFRDLYFDYLRDGLEPKEAIEKAYEIVISFDV